MLKYYLKQKLLTHGCMQFPKIITEPYINFMQIFNNLIWKFVILLFICSSIFFHFLFIFVISSFEKISIFQIQSVADLYFLKKHCQALRTLFFFVCYFQRNFCIQTAIFRYEPYCQLDLISIYQFHNVMLSTDILKFLIENMPWFIMLYSSLTSVEWYIKKTI